MQRLCLGIVDFSRTILPDKNDGRLGPGALIYPIVSVTELGPVMTVLDAVAFATLSELTEV